MAKHVCKLDFNRNIYEKNHIPYPIDIIKKIKKPINAIFVLNNF